MKTQKGITLIALIITIIVLLIIAVVAIGAVQDSGIILHAQNTASQYNQKKGEEESNIIEAEKLIDKYVGNSTPTDQKYLLFTHNEEKGTSTFDGMNPEYKRADGTYGDGNYVITDLVIPTVVKNGSGKDSVVISIAGSPGQEKVSTIKTVVLPETIEMINAYSFKNWTGLTSINIPSKVKNILQCAFENCTSLTTVTIPEGFSTLAFGAFSGCTSLTKAYLPSTISMHGGDQFKGCSSDLTIYVNKYESECSGWPSGWSGDATVIYKTEG